MKQKYFNQFANRSKILIMLLFLSVGFFGFGAANKPSKVFAANCTYNLQFNSNKYSATPSDQLILTATVMRNDLSECTDSIEFEFKLKTKMAPDGTTLNSQTVKFDGNTAKATYNFNLGTFDRASLPVANRFDFLAIGWTSYSQSLKSSVLSVNITGTQGSTGFLHVKVSTKDNKAVYNSGDMLNVLISVDNAADLDSSIQNVYLGVYINDLSKPINSETISASSFKTGVQNYAIAVDPQHNFINGTNTITVKFYQAGTDFFLGQGSATLQAQGIGGGSGTPGNKTDTTNGGGSGQTAAGPGNPPAGVDCSGPNPDPNYCLYNPLPESSLTDMLLTIMKGFLGILALWSVAFIVIGGFRMVMANGNEETYATAKKTITWAILGAVIALLSFSIMAIVQNFLQVDVQPMPTSQTTNSNNK